MTCFKVTSRTDKDPSQEHISKLSIKTKKLHQSAMQKFVQNTNKQPTHTGEAFEFFFFPIFSNIFDKLHAAYSIGLLREHLV